jgi:hypothetical protein
MSVLFQMAVVVEMELLVEAGKMMRIEHPRYLMLAERIETLAKAAAGIRWSQWCRKVRLHESTN